MTFMARYQSKYISDKPRSTLSTSLFASAFAHMDVDSNGRHTNGGFFGGSAESTENFMKASRIREAIRAGSTFQQLLAVYEVRECKRERKFVADAWICICL